MSRKLISYRQNSIDFGISFLRPTEAGIEIAKGEPLNNVDVDRNFCTLQENKVDINGSTIMSGPLKTPGITSTNASNGLIIRKADGASVIARLGKDDSLNTELTGKLILGEISAGVGDIEVNPGSSNSTLNIHCENIPSGDKEINIGAGSTGGNTDIILGSTVPLTTVTIRGKLIVEGVSQFVGAQETTTTTSSIIGDPVSVLGGTENVVEDGYERDRGIEFRWGGKDVTSQITSFLGNGTRTVTAHFNDDGSLDLEVGDTITISGITNLNFQVAEGTWIVKTVSRTNGTGTFTFDLTTLDSIGDEESFTLTAGTYTTGLGNTIKSKIGFFGLDSDTKDFIFIPQSNSPEKFNYRGKYGKLRSNGLILASGALPDPVTKILQIDYEDDIPNDGVTYTIPIVDDESEFIMSTGDQILFDHKTFEDTVFLVNGELTVTSSSGVDSLGTDLVLQAGRSTGSSAGGSIKLKTSGSGESGDELNNAEDRMVIDSSGVTVTGNLILGTGSNKATIRYVTNTSRTLTIPDVDANRTFAFIDQDQTFSTDQTFSSTYAITLNNATAAVIRFNDAGTRTANLFTDATEDQSTKTINIGTGGDPGSITNINLGSADSTSTTTINGDINVKGRLQTSSNISLGSWTTTGISFDSSAATFTNTNGTGTIGTQVTNSFNTPTFASTNAVTVTQASTVYIANRPSAGTNTTITNGHALHVAAGRTYLEAPGTLAIPALAIRDVNTGLYSSAQNVLNVTVGGTSSATFDSSGVSAENFNSTSDIRLKENVQTIENALSIVSSLRGVRYQLKNDINKQSIGVIAQEVESFVPEVVSTSSETGYKSVSYGNLVGLLIESIKELKAEVDQLKNKA